jgi:formylglycine-generating enzyme required for sulfatase activity
MGSPKEEGERLQDETQHEVVLTRGLWLGVHPVTQEQWHAVMGNNPSYFSRSGGGKKKVETQDTKRLPVERVRWDDALEFCSQLAKRGHPEGMAYRLPTEAEWEYACGAGTQTTFHFGKSLTGDEANCNGQFPYGTTQKGKSLERTSEVGTYPANAFGLHDMHGNVWEWCQDWYGEYQAKRQQDPRGLESGSFRVIRGGSWLANAATCRSARRYMSYPASRFHDLGIRLALVPSGN